MNFPERESLVKGVQAHLLIAVDGKDGFKTWQAISDALGIKLIATVEEKNELPISQKAIDLIVKYEVGGGEKYYTKFLQKPTWPQGASGVTIGIGYDLGYNTFSQFEKDWKDKLPEKTFQRLSECLGVKGVSARKFVGGLSDINIPWNSAFEVFLANTLPRFIKETLIAFPHADELNPDAFGALVSLVFNRGASVEGDRRREMLAIRSLVLKKDYQGIAEQIKKSKRLWMGKGLGGLLTRRDEEAQLILNSL